MMKAAAAPKTTVSPMASLHLLRFQKASFFILLA